MRETSTKSGSFLNGQEIGTIQETRKTILSVENYSKQQTLT